MANFQQKPPMWVGGAKQFSDVAANSSGPAPFAPGPGQMNTQQRLDAHYANMVNGFDNNPYAGPQVAKSSAQLPGAAPHASSPWAAPPQEQAAQPSGGGGGGFLSKVASLFAGLF